MRDILSPLDGIRSPFGARRGVSPPIPSIPEGTMIWGDGSVFLLWSGGNYSMVKTVDDADTSVSPFLLMGT
jgi:hypothetical protein